MARSNTQSMFEPLEGRRLMAAGSFDASFGTGGVVTTDVQGAVSKTLVQTDGKIVTLSPDGRIARFNANGSRDTSFALGGGDGDGILTPTGYKNPNTVIADRQRFTDIALQADNKLVVVGAQTPDVDGPEQLLVARFNVDGVPDAAFGSNGKVAIYGMIRSGITEGECGNAVIVDSSGRIVVANRGYVEESQTKMHTATGVIRFTASGVMDSTFGLYGVSHGPTARQRFADFSQDTLVQEPDGNYLVARTHGASYTVRFQRMNDVGATVAQRDVSLVGLGNSPEDIELTSLVPLSNGKVMIGGSAKDAGPQVAFVARFTNDLQLDLSYGNGIGGMYQNVTTGGFSQVQRMLPQTDGRIFEAVSAGVSLTNTTLAVRRIDSAGAFDTLDNTGSVPMFAGYDQGDAAMLPNGKVLFASSKGGFIAFARLNNDVGGISGSVKTGGNGMAGVTVYIDSNNNSQRDSGEPRTLTNAAGNYAFVGVTPGSHKVRQVLPTGYMQTTPTNAGGLAVTVTANNVSGNGNFVNAVGTQPRISTGKISGTVFNDKNGNNVRNTGEAGVSGRVVYIDANNNGKLDSAEKRKTTNASGNYTFDGLSAGIYKVRTVAANGYTPTTSAAKTITLSEGQLKTGVLIGATKLGVTFSGVAIG